MPAILSTILNMLGWFSGELSRTDRFSIDQKNRNSNKPGLFHLIAFDYGLVLKNENFQALLFLPADCPGQEVILSWNRPT